MGLKESCKEVYDRLMVLINEARSLGSEKWGDKEVTSKLLRTYEPTHVLFSGMLTRDKSIYSASSAEVLGELVAQEDKEKRVALTLEEDKKKGVALKVTIGDQPESSRRTSRSSTRRRDETPPSPTSSHSSSSSEDEATAKEKLAFLMKNFKTFHKGGGFKKDKKSTRDRKERRTMANKRCFECSEFVHFAVDCPNKNNAKKHGHDKEKYKKEENERYRKEQRRIKKTHHANFGMKWDSTAETSDSDDEKKANIAICKPSSPQCLFTNLSDDDNYYGHKCLMAKSGNVQPSTTPSIPSDLSDIDYHGELVKKT